MSQIIQWVKEYVGLFLGVTLILYLTPTKEYRGYLRFFLEMLLVLFCLRPMVVIAGLNLEKNWKKTYQSFYEEMEKREQEAADMEYLDWGYINELEKHTEEQEE